MVFGINTDDTNIRIMCNPDADIMKIALVLDKKYKFNRIKTDDNAKYNISATCGMDTLDKKHKLSAKLYKDFKDDLMQINLEHRNKI